MLHAPTACALPKRGYDLLSATPTLVLGTVLRLCLDRAIKWETASVAMVSTPRAKHCEDLLRNLELFLPTKQCFIRESGPDLESKEVATNDVFFFRSN